MRLRVAAFALLLSTCPLVLGVSTAQDASTTADADGKHVRLLTVGNSFSRNATRYLEPLVDAAGHRLTHLPIIVGGASLELHANKADAFARDEKDAAGLYANGRSLRQELESDAWDFVTIQQASIKSHDYDTFQPFATRLQEEITKYAPSATLLVHQTWAYRVDDPRFDGPSDDPKEPTTQRAMYEGLTAAYKRLERDLGIRRLPVGDAFYLADTDSTWGYRPDTAFDLETARHPALPDQSHSLHVGRFWRKQGDQGQWTLRMDGHHANTAGEYLGACVWFETLYEESVVDNAFAPASLAPDYAKFLRSVAHRAVAAAAEEAAVTTVR